MANSAQPPRMMIVPQGLRPVPESFVSFIWDHKISAFLVQEGWAGEAECGATGLGLRVAPGTA
jgi:hypothetical protein